VNRPMRKVGVFIGVLFVALFFNLNWVQVVKGSSYRDNPANRRVLLNEYASPRGQIVATGSAVAQSKATGGELKYLRTYSDGPVYAPVTGYYSFIYGSNGIESAENSILSGDSDQLFTSKLANILTGRDPRGGQVDLTINRQAQEAAYNAMKVVKNGKTTYKKGAVVALDPSTGAILAAVSTPSYDPNPLADHDESVVEKAWHTYTTDPDDPMLDRALNQTYPSGSIFKIIDSAAALEKSYGVTQRIPAPNSYWPLDPSKTSACKSGSACVENFDGEQCDPANSKTATLAQAFAKSCNTAFAMLAVNSISGTALAAKAKQFGLDQAPPSIPLSVAPSTIGSPSDLSDPAALAQTSIGQRDVAITPLQGAMLASAVANDGTLMTPYLVADERKPNLSILKKTEPTQMSTVLSPDLDQQLVQLMDGVVNGGQGISGNTGGSAAINDIPGVVVGGKTGTADHGVPDKNGKQPPPHAWFSGFAMKNGTAKIAVAVIIEDGGVNGNETTGGQAAGPVAKAVMEAYLKSPEGN
jgi:penicillin-binding protein A